MAAPIRNDVNQQDPIQDAMGLLGRWQITITVALSLISFPVAWNQLAMPVIAPRQDFTCVSPTPINISDSMLRACYVKVNGNSPEVKCEKFVYDNSTFKSTIISEWDLVCDRKYLLSLVQPLTQLSILTGNLAAGVVADKIGRRTPLIIAVTVQAVAGTITAFMTRIELFLLFKFISAIATGGTMLIGFVIVMEIIDSKSRSTISILFQVPFALGFLCLPAFSYLTRTWDGYWLSIALPSFLLFSYYWLVPESPRWLLAVGRVDEARQILRKAAKVNKISIEKVNAAIESHKQLLTSDDESIEIEGKPKTYGITDLVRTPVMRKRTLLIVFNWFKDGLVFYGVEYYLGHMSDDVLTSLAISAASIFPGIICTYILISRVPRLRLLMAGNLLSGISLLFIIQFYTNNTVKLMFVTIATTLISITFLATNLYTGELFPTVVRNTGLSVCSIMSKFGSMISPLLIDYINEIAYWIIPLVFGLFSVSAAVSCYWLPETMDCKLPETIEEAETFKKSSQRNSS